MALFKRKENIPEMPPELAFPDLPPVPDLPPLSPNITQPQVRNLTASGYPSSDILQGMQQAIPPMRPAGPPMQQLQPIPSAPRFRMPLPPPPMPPASMAPPAPQAKLSTEDIQEIAEAIISEKWEKSEKEIDEIKRSQEDSSATISGMQERITNVEKKMDMVIQEVLGKVEEYGRGIADVGTELKAMQKVFGTVMPAFTENIKDLQDLVGEAKETGFKKKSRRKR
jgi:hypothetical protein